MERQVQADVTLDIDPNLFRQVLGRFPTGVTVIATIHDGRPVGLTVGSFFSVSLEPPLVGFCVMATSSTWPAIQGTGRFGISVLADDQVDVCQRLATKAPDKFEALTWNPAPITGSPLLDGAVAQIDCVLEQAHLTGDHWIAVGRVVALALPRDEAGPLLFHGGGYGRYQSV